MSLSGQLTRLLTTAEHAELHTFRVLLRQSGDMFEPLQIVAHTSCVVTCRVHCLKVALLQGRGACTGNPGLSQWGRWAAGSRTIPL